MAHSSAGLPEMSAAVLLRVPGGEPYSDGLFADVGGIHSSSDVRPRSRRPSLDDRDLLVANVHDLMQIVGVLVFDVTARDNENTHEDRMTLAKARTKEVNPIQGLETMALTIAHRLRPRQQNLWVSFGSGRSPSA